MITNLQGAQMKHVRDLLARSRSREESGEYVAEGLRMCREIAPEDLVSLYVSESFRKKFGPAEFAQGELVSDSVMEKLSDTKSPQGVLAVARKPRWNREELFARECVSLLFLEHVQDPGNLGTMIRCAEGAGIDGLIVSADSADVWNPKVVRATMGSLLRVPVIVVPDFSEALEEAKASGIRLFAAHLRGEMNYDQVRYPEKTGVLIGNEANGLTEEAAERCDCLVRIPMEGKVESLNAAIAASVFMYEIYRQKRNGVAL